MGCSLLARFLAGAFAVGMLVAPAAHADNQGVVGEHTTGDTHIDGQGIVRTVDCNNRTLHVFGTGNQIFAKGVCWAVTVQGSSNTVVADHVVNDITVYGWDQTVLYRHGDPFLWDRGRELGMTNRLHRVA